MTSESTLLRYKWLIIGAAAIFVCVLFLTNPDQITHLKAVSKTAAFKFQGRKFDTSISDGTVLFNIPRFWLSQTHYQNYGLFSVTTDISGWTLSFGVLGRVHTTDNLHLLLEPVKKE